MDGLFFSFLFGHLQTYYQQLGILNIPDFKGLWIEDLDDHPKPKNPRFLILFFFLQIQSQSSKNPSTRTNAKTYIYGPLHPFFLAKRIIILIQTNQKEKKKAKTKVRYPRPSWSLPVHVKYPPVKGKRNSWFPALQMEVPYPMQCTPDSLNKIQQREPSVAFKKQNAKLLESSTYTNSAKAKGSRVFESRHVYLSTNTTLTSSLNQRGKKAS